MHGLLSQIFYTQPKPELNLKNDIKNRKALPDISDRAYFRFYFNKGMKVISI